VYIAGQLKKVAELRDQGILSGEEFKEAKRKILDNVLDLITLVSLKLSAISSLRRINQTLDFNPHR
jgi:hypothetical protein